MRSEWHRGRQGHECLIFQRTGVCVLSPSVGSAVKLVLPIRLRRRRRLMSMIMVAYIAARRHEQRYQCVSDYDDPQLSKHTHIGLLLFQSRAFRSIACQPGWIQDGYCFDQPRDPRTVAVRTSGKSVHRRKSPRYNVFPLIHLDTIARASAGLSWGTYWPECHTIISIDNHN